MKSLINKFLLSLVILGFVGCNQTDFDVEQYKKVIYVLSSGKTNVYDYNHDLSLPESMGYLTIYCSGTRPIDTDVTIEMEMDSLNLFDRYNEVNFDLDETKYAKILNPSFYDIDSYSVQMKVGQADPYVLFPIRVRPVGLSPDSSYFIPLTIKGVSNYEINKERRNVLYRIRMKNDYALAGGATTYAARGRKVEEGKNPVKIASNKKMYALDGNILRMGMGTESVDYGKIADINYKTMKIIINSDNSITLEPYNSKYVQIQQLGGAAANNFYEEKKIQKMKLSYRYRKAIKEPEPGMPAEWGAWVTMQEETLKRID